MGFANSKIKVFCKFLHQRRSRPSFFDPLDTDGDKFCAAGIPRHFRRFNDTPRGKLLRNIFFFSYLKLVFFFF